MREEEVQGEARGKIPPFGIIPYRQLCIRHMQTFLTTVSAHGKSLNGSTKVAKCPVLLAPTMTK